MNILDTECAEKAMNADFPFDLVVQKQELSKIGSLKSELAGLRRLDVAFNNLTTLWGLEQLPNLRTLSAYCNQIADINGLQGVSRLECLRLQQNGIVELVDSITSMRKLRELRLDHNSLTRLDSYLRNCSSLQQLDLSSNRLITPDGIAGLQSLMELRLANNSIRTLLPLRALPNLKELDVSYNKLSSLEGLQNLNNLETLHAEHNNIKTLKISQTYSKGNKALDPTNSSLSSSAATAAAALSRQAVTPPVATDTVLGMAFLAEVFLANNNLSSLDGLDTLGVAIEILDIGSNVLDSNDEKLNLLLRLKKLSEIRLAGNPLKHDVQFFSDLTSNLLKCCTSLRAVDDQSFTKDTKKKQEQKSKKSFHTWDDMSSSRVGSGVSQEEDVSTIATRESDIDLPNDASELLTSDEEDNEEENPDDCNAHNAGLYAPTLSLKDMKTPEEISAMELNFTSLLTSCKETLFTILLKPEEPFVSRPRIGTEVPSKDQRKAKEDSVEEAAFLFHHSSVETVSGFRDYVDHRGNLIRGSQLVTDDGNNRISNAGISSPVQEPLTFNVYSSVIVETTLHPCSSSPSSIAENSTTSGSSKTKSYVRLSERPFLGSGLTRHGTKIKQKGVVKVEKDSFIELLQGRHSSIVDMPKNLKSSVLRGNTPDDGGDLDHTGESAFLTSASSASSLPPASIMHQQNAIHNDLPSWTVNDQISNSQSRFKKLLVKQGLGLNGIDTRFIAQNVSGTASARSLPDTRSGNEEEEDEKENTDEIDKIIQKIKGTRRYSEPFLIATSTPVRSEKQLGAYDDSDDDGDGSRSVSDMSSTNCVDESKVLKTFRTPKLNSLNLSSLETVLLTNSKN